MNRKKIFTKKKVTGTAALLVALAIILTGTFAWKDFSQSTLSLFSADATPKHWVSLVDDFQSATNVETNTLEGWRRGDIATKQVYISSKLTNEKANPTGIVADPEDVYNPVYVRVMLTQELTIGGGDPIDDPKADPNSINQYPTYVKWNDNTTIKTIDKWAEEESKQGAYWILDNTTGWLYWAEPLEFGEETEHLLDTVELLVEPEKDLEYTVNVKLEAVSSDLDSTTGTNTDTVDYLGGFKDWGIANTDKIMLLFEPFEFTIETTSADEPYTLQVNDNAANDFVVYWGDGTSTHLSGATILATTRTRTYATAGVYTIKIIGTMPSAMSFLNDTKLTSVKSGFLENTASDMKQYFYGCENLKAIPGNLFAKSTAVTNFASTFSNCSGLTGSIPADLFKYNTKAENFSAVFNNCNGLMGLIPADLFKTNTAVTSFNATFSNCSGLTGAIPADLFKNNTAVTTFRQIFMNCISLTSIPEDLFKTNTAVISFRTAFQSCSSLNSIPADLFKYNTEATEFINTFNGCTNITSALPTLWLSHSSADHDNAFTGCINATNIGAARIAGWAAY